MKQNEAEQVIKILTEALPYIQKFSKKICIVKYGGAAMTDNNLKNSFARDIALMKQVGINVVVVHGGGPQIDEQLKKVGIKRNFKDGIRVTDTKTIEIDADTLTNLVNKELEENPFLENESVELDNQNDQYTEKTDELEETFDIMLDTDDIIDFSSYDKGMEILERYDIKIKD